MKVPAARAALVRVVVGEGIAVVLAVQIELDLTQLVGLARDLEDGLGEQRFGDPSEPARGRVARGR